ncbi:hypothetical protein FOZ63_017172, partial [Perkinsus olseni]
SELRREKMQVDYDAAVVSLSSMREARDAAVAELEEAKEELGKEKELVRPANVYTAHSSHSVTKRSHYRDLFSNFCRTWRDSVRHVKKPKRN